MDMNDDWSVTEEQILGSATTPKTLREIAEETGGDLGDVAILAGLLRAYGKLEASDWPCPRLYKAVSPR